MTTSVAAVHGRINDLDSHLQVPVSRWGEVFGEATARMGAQFAGHPFFDATDEPERHCCIGAQARLAVRVTG